MWHVGAGIAEGLDNGWAGRLLAFSAIPVTFLNTSSYANYCAIDRCAKIGAHVFIDPLDVMDVFVDPLDVMNVFVDPPDVMDAFLRLLLLQFIGVCQDVILLMCLPQHKILYMCL
jgi:hypothetical protein